MILVVLVTSISVIMKLKSRWLVSIDNSSYPINMQNIYMQVMHTSFYSNLKKFECLISDYIMLIDFLLDF